MSDWQDMIVGDRMTVDEEFSARIDNSRFTRQEWGLIMTATSFEVENPGDETGAELVADTSELPTMIPELDKVAQMGPMGQPQDRGNSGGGLLDSLLGALGLGDGGDDGVDDEKLEAAESLAAAYAEELQAHLEAEGRWGEIRAAAAAESNEA